MVCALGLAFVPAPVEDCSDLFLAGGVVSGDIEQVMGSTGLQASKLVDQGLAGHPREECVDDVRIDDIRERVASLEEPTDVISQGLTGLLLATLEVLGVSRADIRSLEISDEDPLEVRPVVDAVVREELKPCPNVFPHADEEILNDEIVIIHPSGSAGKSEIFEPNTGVCLPSVLGVVGGRSEALWERRSPDTPVKGLWSRALRARTLVVWPATMPGARFTAPLDGSAGTRVACPHRRPVDVIIMPGLMPVADDAMSVLVWTKPFTYR